MKKNLGSTDRIVRLFIGIVLAIAYFTHLIGGTLGLIWMIAGLVLAFTSFISFCPIYWMFKISSCKKQEAGLK
jgi:amino acid transporter